MRLREIVHAHIPLLREDSTVRDAVDKMDIYQFPGLVIVNEESLPIALVTEGDLVRGASKHDNFTRMANDPALIYATKDPTTMPADTEISDAYYRMVMSGLTLLPVIDSGVLVGVVLRVDLMQAMLLDAQMSSVPD